MSYSVIQLPINTTNYDDLIFSKLFRSAEKIENKVMYHVKQQVYEMKKTKTYKKWLHRYIEPKNNKEKQIAKKKLHELTIKFGLTKNLIEQYAKKQNIAYKGCIQASMTQWLADNVYTSLEKVLYGNGNHFNFKKFGDCNYIRTKFNSTGFIYKPELQSVIYKGRVYKLIVRDKDYYAKEMLSIKDIAYTALVRESYKHGYRYFFQITFKNTPYPKKQIGKGIVGIDIGTSTIAVVGDNNIIFEPLLPDIDKYNKQIIQKQKELERSRRVTNPDNYNEDGTIKKSNTKLTWVRSNHYNKTLFELKNLYRKRQGYKKTYIGNLTNRILEMGNTFVKEDMDFKALQKRSKTTDKSDKTIDVVKKDGSVKQVKKNKKKKRFGKSLNNHSPATVILKLEQKLNNRLSNSVTVNKTNYKASQYNHIKDEYIKTDLNERIKQIGDIPVQRDLYSAFLLKSYKDINTVDKDKCDNDFLDFIDLHNQVMNNLLELDKSKQLPSCMGCKIYNKTKKQDKES